MEPEKVYELIKVVTANDFNICKRNLWEIMKITNSLLIDRSIEKNYFETERQQSSDLLLQRVLMYGASIYNLTDGVSYAVKNHTIPKIYDPFSMKVLLRGLLESYLTLYHINFSDTEMENDIRYKIWVQYSLAQRGKMSFLFLSEDDTKNLNNEKEYVQTLISEIKSSEFFVRLDQKKQEKFLNLINRDWKLGFNQKSFNRFSWQQLIDNTGINKILFSDVYNFLSWFSHSTFLSITQLKDFYQNELQIEETKSVIKETSIFIALACTDLIKIDTELKNQYFKLPQSEKDLINSYNYVYRGEKYTIEDIRNVRK